MAGQRRFQDRLKPLTCGAQNKMGVVIMPYGGRLKTVFPVSSGNPRCIPLRRVHVVCVSRSQRLSAGTMEHVQRHRFRPVVRLQPGLNTTPASAPGRCLFSRKNALTNGFMAFESDFFVISKTNSPHQVGMSLNIPLAAIFCL